MTMPGWVQNVAAITIVLAAAVWLLRRAIWKKDAPQGCENCPAHRPARPAHRPPARPASHPTPASRSERA